MNFTSLHHCSEPLIICNIWDVESARIAVAENFMALGTSSGAIASMLGYKDGEEMSFEELEYIVGRITQNIRAALSVDLEAGYSRNPSTIVEHIKRLEQVGVVGVNIEDSLVDVERTLLSEDQFCRLLDKVSSKLVQQKVSMFLNVRTDTFLLGSEDPLSATIQRAKRYTEAGADGLFVPCIEEEFDIKNLIDNMNIPLNVMCMPNLPDFETLKRLGVKRISMGDFVYRKLCKSLSEEIRSINLSNSFQTLLN